MSEGKRALLSVSDKTGIVDFARELSTLGIEIISTGGTARVLEENDITVIPVDTVTGFPEMMDGRVKTLHPRVHGALLGRRDNTADVQQAESEGIRWIDIVAVNLYPFEETVADENVSLAEAIENIDIGGPSMLRSSAKNHMFVTVVCDPADYPEIIAQLKKNGETSLQLRTELACKAFRRTADYDAAIDTFLSEKCLDEPVKRMSFRQGSTLRYGENSHQGATFFRDPASREPSIAHAEILHGKAMSFNNYVDADAAFEAVRELADGPGVAVIKHTNPCGYATGETVREALENAWAGDPISAFGSVIACNLTVDLDFAEFLKGKNVNHIGYIIEKGRLIPRPFPSKFVEVIAAPDFTEEALSLLGNVKNLRLLKTAALTGNMEHEKETCRKITGGLLEMDRDLAVFEKFETATRKEFSDNQRRLAEFAYKACKHTKSNAIVLAREYRPGFFQVIGMGAGQPNRVDSLRKLAVPKAVENLQIEFDISQPDMSFDDFVKDQMGRMVMASDAFFPFDDTVREAAEFGIKYIIQPGGSKRDCDSVEACNELGLAMAMTGLRHFKH